MANQRNILWFRNDLRLHDNEALYDATKNGNEILPVYVFDQRLFEEKSPHGFPRIGAARALFIIQSVTNLRENLKKKGCNLLVKVGKPEEVIIQLVKKYSCNDVYCNRERLRDDLYIQDELEKAMWAIGREVRYSRGKMLLYTSDLPFPISHTPDSFLTFKKEVEKIVDIREPIPTPDSLYPFLHNMLDYGNIPTLKELGFSNEDVLLAHCGGEDIGKIMVDEFFWKTDKFALYHLSKDELIDPNLSSHLSPYLSVGCISPKYIYTQILLFEKIRKRTKSASELINDLLLRDYYRLIGKKEPIKIFEKTGITGDNVDHLIDDISTFNRWKTGNLGVPLVDALMRCGLKTGHLAFRGRLILANYLVNILNINWQLGAEHYECTFLDHDPASNYLNWNNIAGIGIENHIESTNNIPALTKKYDPNCSFIKKWIPELTMVEPTFIYQMQDNTLDQLIEAGLDINGNYLTDNF